MRRFAPLGLSAILLLASTGCESRHTGDRGELVFVYDAFDQHENFNKPIAQGATLEMRVEPVGVDADDELLVRAMRSSDPAIARPGDFVSDTFELHARSPGSFVLSVDAAVDDTAAAALSDQVRMRVSKTSRIELMHACTGEPSAFYMAGSRAVGVEYSRYDARGELQVGVGPMPLKMKEGSVRRVTSAFDVLVDLTDDERAHVLSSPLSDRDLVFRTIALSSVDGLSLSEFDEGAAMAVGTTMIVEFVPKHRGSFICGEVPGVQARVSTPKVCEILEQGDFVELRALSYGMCVVDAWVPGAARSARTRASFAVGTFPGDGHPDPGAATLSSDEPAPQQAPATPWWLAPLLALLAPITFAPYWILARRR